MEKLLPLANGRGHQILVFHIWLPHTSIVRILDTNYESPSTFGVRHMHRVNYRWRYSLASGTLFGIQMILHDPNPEFEVDDGSGSGNQFNIDPAPESRSRCKCY